MANALITIEERLYTERGAVGGDGWQEWEVVSRAEETPDVASLLLRPADGRPTLAFRAGQCVSVQVELADGARQIRPDRGALRGDPLDHGEAGARDGHDARRRVLAASARACARGRPAAGLGPVRRPRPGGRRRAPAARLRGHRLHPGAGRAGRAGGRAARGSRHLVHADRSPGTHALRASHEALAA